MTSERSSGTPYANFQTWVHILVLNGDRALSLIPLRLDYPCKLTDMHIDYIRSNDDLELTLGQANSTF